MSQVLIQQSRFPELIVKWLFAKRSKTCSKIGGSRDLIFVPEYEIATSPKDHRYVDGALVHTARVPFGYCPELDVGLALLA